MIRHCALQLTVAIPHDSSAAETEDQEEWHRYSVSLSQPKIQRVQTEAGLVSLWRLSANSGHEGSHLLGSTR